MKPEKRKIIKKLPLVVEDDVAAVGSRHVSLKKIRIQKGIYESTVEKMK